MFSPLFRFKPVQQQLVIARVGFAPVVAFWFVLCGSSKHLGGLDITIRIVLGRLSNRLLPFCSPSDPNGGCVSLGTVLQTDGGTLAPGQSSILPGKRLRLCLPVVRNRALDFNGSLQFVLLKAAQPVKNWELMLKTPNRPQSIEYLDTLCSNFSQLCCARMQRKCSTLLCAFIEMGVEEVA